MLDRRQFLWQAGGGLGGIALAWLLGREGLLADSSGQTDGLHHPARARRVVQIFLAGGASQVDTFDYKPELIRRHGQPFDPGGKVELFQSTPGHCMKSPWTWRQHGQCGKWVSGLLPHLARHVDDLAFIHSMEAPSNVHGPALFSLNSGFTTPGFPSMGSWIVHGLGSLTDNLPAFVVLPDRRGLPPNGPQNWGTGFLPAGTQGTVLRTSEASPIADLHPAANDFLSPESEMASRALLHRLNERHRSERRGDSRLAARIAAYELAARLQVRAHEVFDLSREPEMIRRSYGLDRPVTADFGRNCLLARRLLERGVRFVQLWSGAENARPRRNWDAHEDIAADHQKMADSFDQPTAALLADLKARGLLEDTLVLGMTEFGRMPCSQGNKGRDHNPFAFTCWLAGGGVPGGTIHGASDEWSYRVASDPMTCHDLHATVLHLLGIDHTRLVFRHGSINRRLTDVHGRVVRPLLG